MSASKHKLGPDEALALARAANEVLVAKGKQVLRFDMKKDPPDDDALLEVILGRSGTLRAPTVRVGKRLLIGFHQEAFSGVFG